MTYRPLVLIAEWEIFLFLGLLAGMIGVWLLTGKINTRYLFFGTRGDGTRYFSPERVQLLVITLGVAVQYLFNANDAAQTGKMPDLPAGTLEVLGLSNALYLGGKALAFTRNALGGKETNS